MTLLNDTQITELATAGMIRPFSPELVRRLIYEPSAQAKAECCCPEAYPDLRSNPCDQKCTCRIDRPVLSYGLSSYGYDIQLSPKDFQIFRHIPGTIMDPKKFNPANLSPATLHHDPDGFGSYFVLPAHSYGLGVAFQHLSLPPDVTAIALGKSTYARLGIIANMTPAEAGWKGHLTLEFSNSSGADCRIYANEGICQLLFFRGDTCATSYEDRKGKYQNQTHTVTHARV